MAEKTKLKGAPGEGDATAATAGAGASEFARGEELPRAQSPARQFLK